ncbi:HAD family hydrolase [Microvirga sp. 17 mud 1-3]|uniref:HAD family hydrolase n=1 Tax=Microvirga sp. 17 mud 1-3 TaxID=2082949 RepID=UPI000D6C5A68|nr:HAD family hydrolase [Microvirga sp. 17 mud 1-3]AWM88789.1 HAD family hydrolase [Microvirga sp. 17 mud 1-3]
MIALFDLDGTLTDPKTGITRSVQYALERLGRPVPEADALTWMIGPPLIAGFSELLGGPEDAPEAVRLYRERFSDVGLFENEVYAGIPALLARLRDEEVRLFVATSKPHVYARRIVEHFGLAPFFGEIYGSELDNRNTDKRDLIRHILAQEGFDPAGAVMIGDRKHDAIGARANGLAAIGVTWGYGSRQELQDAGVACLVDDPGELEAPIRDLTAAKPLRAAGA